MLEYFIKNNPKIEKELRSYLQPLKLTADEVILDFGEHSRNVFLIVSGCAWVFKKTKRGRCTPLFRLGQDQAINLEALSQDPQLNLKYVAETPVVLMRIEVELLKRFPDLLNAYTLKSIAVSHDACMEGIHRFHAKERLLWLLLLLWLLVVLWLFKGAF